MSVLPLDAADEVATEPVPPSRTAAGAVAVASSAGRAASFGAAWLVLLVVASFTAALWRPYEVDDAGPGPPAGAARPARHWLGTDPLGRDLLSRIFTAGAEPLLASALTRAGRLRHRPAAGADRRRARPAGRAGDQPADRDRSWRCPSTIILLAVIGVIGTKIYLVMAILGVLISAARLPDHAGRRPVGAAAALRRRRPGQRPGLAAGQPACTCCRRWPRWSRSRPRSCSASAC